VPSTTILMTIGILICSLIVGISFYYVINKSNRKEKKQQIDQFLSYAINFILFVWAGKVILQLPLFFQDPLAVLAYPSDSRSVYIATILLIIQITYHILRKQLHILTMIETTIPIFIATVFMHEFLQLMIEGNRYGIPNLILMTALLFLYLFLHDKQSIRSNTMGIITIFCFSHISFYIVYSYTTVFDYMLHPMYFLSIFVLSVGLFLYDWQRN